MFSLPPHPYDQSEIDAIDRRILHLRGLCGVLMAATGDADVACSLEHLRNLAWLLDDYLVEIADLAKGMHESSQEVR